MYAHPMMRLYLEEQWWQHTDSLLAGYVALQGVNGQLNSGFTLDSQLQSRKPGMNGIF